MARYAALATGNFTTLATWGLVDATSLLDSELQTHTVTSAYSGTRTAAFTPGAIVVQGIALKLNNRSGTTGTVSVHLALNATHVEVAGTLVTINMADLPVSDATSNNGGWLYFEFAAPVTLLAATAYEIEVRTSSSTQAILWRDGTAANVSRMLVTTANPGALAAGDTFHIMKRHTAAGASTAVTITMDNTATTDFGAGTDNVVALTISDATLTWGTTASTNYYLKLSGDLIMYAGATMTIGTSGTRVPVSSSAVLEFDPVADGGMGLIVRNLATLQAYGAVKTPWRLLAADVAVSATSGTVDSNVAGWLTGDSIAFAPTTRTSTQFEAKTLTADADGTTSIAFNALTYAHDGGNGGPGGASDAAEVCNLTRNVKIRGVSAALPSYVWCRPTATVSLDNVEVYNVGASGTGKTGVVVETVTGTVSLDSCAIHDVELGGLQVSGASGTTGTYNNCVFYNLCTGGVSAVAGVVLGSGTGAATFTNNVIIGTTGTGNSGILLNAPSHIVTGCRVSGAAGTGSGGGFRAGSSGTWGTFASNVAHSNAGTGINYANAMPVGSMAFTSCVVWRNASAGLAIAVSVNSGVIPTITDLVSFGNVSNLSIGSGSSSCEWLFLRAKIDAEAAYTSAIGFDVQYQSSVKMIDCTIGTVGTHTTSDLRALGGGASVDMFNCTLGSATEVSAIGVGLPLNFVRLQRRDQTGTLHKSWYANGTIESNQTTRHTASGYSWRMTPLSATYKLILPGPTTFGTFAVPARGGVAKTINAYVYKDSAYNGVAPRLVVKGGLVQGIAADVTDSLTVAHSNWEQLTVTVTPSEDCVIEWYIDCSGTAGSIYVDDVSVSP